MNMTSSYSNLYGVKKVVDLSNFLPLWHKATKREEKKKNQHSILILLDGVPIDIVPTNSSTSTCNILLTTIIIIVGGGGRGHHRPPLAMGGQGVALTPSAPPQGLHGSAQCRVRVKLWLLLLLLLLLIIL